MDLRATWCLYVCELRIWAGLVSGLIRVDAMVCRNSPCQLKFDVTRSQLSDSLTCPDPSFSADVGVEEGLRIARHKCTCVQ